MPSDVFGQRRLKSDCEDVQFDQGLRCPLSESLATIKYIHEEQRAGRDLTHAQDDVNQHNLLVF